MSTPDAVIYVDLYGETHLVGFLSVGSGRGGTLATTFHYADAWLEHGEAFAVDPLLDLSSGGFHMNRLFAAIGEDPHDTSASLELAFEVAAYFDLKNDEARAVAREVADVTVHWADRARTTGITGSEIDLMMSAFEHEDLDLALGG